MSKTIRWGILGLGKIANKFASDLALVEDAILYAVGSRDMNKANEFGKKYGAKKFYGSYEELSKDPDIDIIYIATTNNLHYQNTIMCLNNGKSVLCEKPLGLDSKEVTEMIQLAKSKNLFLMEALWTRFIPSTKQVLKLIDNGTIGNIKFIRADFGFKGNSDPKLRLYNKNLGGGSLLDIGIYPIYLSLLTLGVPNDISSMARISDTGVDSYAGMVFTYENNIKAFLESTFETDTGTEAYIYGESGVIKMHKPFHHTKRISIYSNNKATHNIDIEYIGNGYYHEIVEVNHCIRNGLTESTLIPHSLSIDLMSIMDQVRRDWKV